MLLGMVGFGFFIGHMVEGIIERDVANALAKQLFDRPSVKKLADRVRATQAMPSVDTHSYVWIARTILPSVTGALMGGLLTLYTFAIVLLKWHLLVMSGVGAIVVQVMLYHAI